MKSRNILTSILLMGLMSFSVQAQEVEGLDVPENEVMGFSRIIRDPAKLAKGGAGIANPNSIAWSSFDNSSVIPFSEKTLDVGLLYQHWAPQGVKSSNFGVGVAGRFLDHFGVSLGFIMQQGQPFSLINDSGVEGEEQHPTDMQFNLGLAYRIGDVVSVGLNAKYFSSRLMDDLSYSSFATDIFAQCRISGVSFAAGLSNLGASVKDASGLGFKLPTSVTLGADYTLEMGEVHALNFDADLDYFLSGNLTAGLGVEYGFNEMVYARAGYHYGSKQAILPSFATVGLGFQFFGVRLDFSYLTANKILGNTMTIGLGYAF